MPDVGKITVRFGARFTELTVREIVNVGASTGLVNKKPAGAVADDAPTHTAPLGS